MGLFSFLNKKQGSGKIAKNRLELVLVQDRMNTSPEVLEMLKSDILKVLSNYVDIDEKGLDIIIGNANNSNGFALEASIPIKAWKKR